MCDEPDTAKTRVNGLPVSEEDIILRSFILTEYWQDRQRDRTAVAKTAPSTAARCKNDVSNNSCNSELCERLLRNSLKVSETAQ